MKKVFFLMMMLIASISVSAQNLVEGKHVTYVELLGYESMLSTKVKVMVDMGQNQNKTNYKLRDENDKPIKFNSMVDALNYMTKRGWEYVNSFPVTHSNQNVYHYLLKKYIAKDEEMQEGLNLEKED